MINLKDSSSECIEDVKDIVERLKSLRPQSQWKPSEEQMNTLFECSERNDRTGAILRMLYNDLKRL